MFNGLKRPEVFKLFSTILDISDPMFSFLIIFLNSFLDCSSIAKGETVSSLKEKVLRKEHILYSEALRRYLKGKNEYFTV